MQLVTRADLGWPESAAPPQATTQGAKVHYEGTHVATDLLANHGLCIQEWQDIRASHLGNKVENYSDIAYSFGACPHGYLLEGRGIGRRTGANGSQPLNKGHYAIVGLVGDSGLTDPTPEMLNAIRDGIELLQAHGAGPEIKGHRDGYATSCPGGPLYAWVQAGAPRPDAPAQPGPAPQLPAETTPARYQNTIAGVAYGYGAHGPQVREIGEALVARGFGAHYQVGPDEDWRDADTLNYQAYQRSLGYSGTDADGVPGESSLRELLGHLPGETVVSLARVVAAARTDPDAEQGHQTYGAEARTVEQALADEGFLEGRWVDGSFGTRTVAAYRSYQRSLGYGGSDADGIPGLVSLTELGRRRGFTVTN
ncbi:peptidoglycan-binding protein [Kitasatospora sp. MBT66]|uniref:peptidoglycan-binding protein n=1 Tax=Kitasatospora sp. MBT66 TaxID=1444769 RepID=UPI000AFB492E|nr:peptidoglycan-binding protein [Kitasatospora sp. MBT66]